MDNFLSCDALGSQWQHTLSQPTSVITGRGVHNGTPADVCIFPANHSTGIVFWRTDLEPTPTPIHDLLTTLGRQTKPHSTSTEGADEENDGITAMESVVRQSGYCVRADTRNVKDTRRCTVIAHTHADVEVCVSTVEHLMFALYACGVDNAVVALNSDELPIHDGSAQRWVEAIMSAGVKKQNHMRKIIRMTQGISVYDDATNGEAHIMPLDDWHNNDRPTLDISFAIAYDAPIIGWQEQRYTAEQHQQIIPQVSAARTFVMKQQVDMLKGQGLLKGGDLSSMLIVDKTCVDNPDGLRWPDEFVRHKILDALGDLFLIGSRLVGRVVMVRSGHTLNNRLAREINRVMGNH